MMADRGEGESRPLTYDAARRVLGALDGSEGAVAQGFPVVSGYVLESEIGSGAGGTTYLARKEGSEARVALKVLRRTFGSGGGKSRVWRELDLLQQLRLPSVPRLLDFGATDRSLFLATEFIEGVPLDRRFAPAIPGDAAGLRARVRVLERLARAVQTLHEHGVIHRDIKPSNVVLSADDRPHVVDLGIATLVTPDPMETLSLEGAPVGTPAFMAPEQARGERGAISTRSDIYGIGAVGYWLCTGFTPHDLAGATLHEAIRRVGSEPPREPRAIAEHVPKGLAAVLARACAQRPEERYPSAADLAEDLARWLRGEPVAAARGRWHRTVLWIARRPAAVAGLLLVVALPVAGVAVTALLVYLSNFRPAQLALDADHSAVSLLALNGRQLHRWEPVSPEPMRVLQRTFLDEEKSRALVAFRGYQEREPEPLAAIYRTAGPSRPEVVFEFPERVHPALRAAAPVGDGSDSMALDIALLADVFPESDGPTREELITSFHHARRSPACVRIFSLEGELLFEAWHDGHISSAFWMEEPRLLVLAGVNSDGKWQDRGDRARRSTYPVVVFAIRPTLGATGRLVSWPGFDGDIEPAWYRAVLPPSISDFIDGTPRLAAPPEFGFGSPYVMFEVDDEDYRDNPAPARSIAWILDADGEVIDHYGTSGWTPENGLPDASETFLGPLPARSSQREGN